MKKRQKKINNYKKIEKGELKNLQLRYEIHEYRNCILKVSKSQKQNTKFSHTPTKFCTYFCPSL